MAQSTIAVESPGGATPPAQRGPSLRRYGAGTLFLLPAFVLLGIWIVYPTIYTIARSFFGPSGFDDFVGIDNYKALFTTPTLTTAIKNNLIWVAVVPAFVTSIGLIFAVLTERVGWAFAFKTVVFLPMAISAFATGVTWRIMYVQDPNLGAVNALGRSLVEVVKQPGSLSTALPSTPEVQGNAQSGMVLKVPLQPGGVALIGLTGIPPTDVPSSATQAVVPASNRRDIVGVVWRDFKPGGGVPGKVESAGGRAARGDRAAAEQRGQGRQDGSVRRRRHVRLRSGRTRDVPRRHLGTDLCEALGWFAWLGTKLITPSLIIAYIWIWAGFSMVVIAAGLSAMPREVLEAARTDGASEWQVFRRVTVPLLAPVLSVVFITMIINVLKVFDLVITLAPGSSQNAGSVIALAMWRTSFGGINDFGVGSAIAVFLFVLVVPVLLLNVKRFRREA